MTQTTQQKDWNLSSKEKSILTKIYPKSKRRYYFDKKDVKRYIQEQEGKKAFEYDIYECPEELKGQLKIGDFYG